uniref:Uncharacterized protein AlNc14C9G1204 n=1 Tax=Albugo laibachii Nc14 TaxID=890382 RepID=F0W2F3_9STRA|nr:conserved hypothetical protein [Albugo laibachii Nc14]|eukprot:CCA15239.1 conserved hypothetical protein [Albugo laibachii Nc14]
MSYASVTRSKHAQSGSYTSRRVPLSSLLDGRNSSQSFAGNASASDTNINTKKWHFLRKVSQKKRRQLRSSCETEFYIALVLEDFYLWESVLEYLDYEAIDSALFVNKEWSLLVRDHGASLIVKMYERKWRADSPPLNRMYRKLPYHRVRCLCQRPRELYDQHLTTFCRRNTLENGLLEFVNDSMLRSFSRGAIGAVYARRRMDILSCAKALEKKLCYFEVTFRGSGSIGFIQLSESNSDSVKGFGTEEHIGWRNVSYGYHGNDGDFVYNEGNAPYGGEWKPFGPSWGAPDVTVDFKSDTVGCGLDYTSREIFYTLNGQFIGVAPIRALRGIHACAFSLNAFGDSAVLNGGKAPFLFDIENFCINRVRDDRE